LPLLRLAVLDVDGTLKQAESPYQYLHGRLGVEHLAEPNRLLARAGQISYAEWLRRDALLWAGQPVTHIQRLLAENPFLAGAPELLRALKRAGVVVALVSAGFTLNTDPILNEFGLDYALANELTVVDDVLDGGAVNHVPEGGKAAFACELMERLGIPPGQTLAAGDTSGDLELFECAGVRMAVNPTSNRLRAIADVTFEPDLVGAVAWLIGSGYLPVEVLSEKKQWFAQTSAARGA
jgi:HAD superfamily phosphoserine phosphatase-like hydrolase